MIASSLSEQEISGLKELFKSIDEDNSGSITFDELKNGLARHGTRLPEDKLQELMEAVRGALLAVLLAWYSRRLFVYSFK